MKIHELIDFLQRKINSILFRFVLISYSISLLFLFENYFDTYLYVILILVYMSSYFLCLKYQKLRLINDIGFMILITLGKNPNEVLIFIFLLLPIVNSINFSGVKKSPLLYIYTFITYLLLSCFFAHNYNLDFLISNYTPIISLFFLWIIDQYTSLRTKIRDFRESLNEVVDNFYTNKEVIKKPHKIYNLLINVINTKIKKDYIKELYCFTTINDKSNLVVVNGTNFIWNYEFKDNEFLRKLREKRQFVLNTPLTIDSDNKSNNISILIEIEDYEYIFVFVTSLTIPIYYLIIGLFRLLEPALSKMANILLSEKRLQELKTDELVKISERRLYVIRANKTMHYIRNRLGPITNLISLIEKINTVPKNKKEEFDQIFKSEKDRTKIELKDITERANYLLEKSNNPFNFNVKTKFSIRGTFSVFKRNFFSYFPENEIKVTDGYDHEGKFVLLNEEGFEIFLSDWLNNIRKYKKANVYTEFNITENELIIKFSNDFTNTVASINKMIADLMSNDRNEIMQRTTHGLYQIKTTLEEMQIPFTISLSPNKELITLVLTIKIYQNEDSNL